MRSIILLLLFNMLGLFCWAQTKESNQFLEKGNSSLKAGDLAKAVEYYSVSIEKYPSINGYFNRALAYMALKDTCHYCRDFLQASEFGDSEAGNYYQKNCIMHDTIWVMHDTIREEFPGCKYGVLTHAFGSSDTSLDYYNSDNKVVESIFDKFPEFPGGEKAMNEFLASHIRYPHMALEYGIQGTVLITFTVQKDGSLLKPMIARGIGGGCDEEAIRVVKLMPAWKPATRKGVPVECKFIMPTRFVLQ
jgi:TonB family protein